MKIEKLVEQRLDELEQKATDLLAKKESLFSHEGVEYFKVDPPSFKAWAASVLNILQRVFEENSIHYRHFDEEFRRDKESQWASTLEICKALLQAASEDYKGGYLFNVRGLIQAEVFDSFLEQANELLNSGYKDPACVVAGVAIETTLKELCTRNQIPHGKLDKMNTDLCKAGVYNMGMQKQITAWAERRNKAAHGEWSNYNTEEVAEMIRGANRLTAEYL